jgi:hypothetical protein
VTLTDEAGTPRTLSTLLVDGPVEKSMAAHADHALARLRGAAT